MEPAGKLRADLQRVANASTGWHDPQLYSPGRLPIVPEGVVRYQSGKLALDGSLAVILMPKLKGTIEVASDPNGNGTMEAKALALSTVIGAGLDVEIFEKKYLGLDAWAAYNFIEPVMLNSNATPPSRFAFVLEPNISARFGMLHPTVGFLIPMGEQLGGQVNGVRLNIALDF